MKLEEMEFGMKVKDSFKTAIEKQVSEEKKEETTLLNSRSEFNRCKIQRITMKNMKKELELIEEENEEEKVVKEMIRELRKKKRERDIERKALLKTTLIDI